MRRPARFHLLRSAIASLLMITGIGLSARNDRGKSVVARADVLILTNGKEDAGLETSGLSITVGEERYFIESVRKPTSLKRVVVFDLASIEPQDLNCFVEQMKAFVLEQGEGNVFVVPLSANGTDWFEFGRGAYRIFDQAQFETGSCNSPRRDKPRTSLRTEIASQQSLLRMMEALWPGPGPIQIVWVGQSFDWVVPRRVKRYPEPDPGPDIASTWMPWITQLGLTLFPVVWTKDASEDARIEGEHVSLARKGAYYLGGEATECQGNLTPCLEGVFLRGSSGWVIRVSGPPVDESNWAFPPILKVWRGADRTTPVVERPFAIPADPSERFPAVGAFYEELSAATAPLFSVWLDTKPGCHPDREGHVPSRGITLLVPRDVVQKGGARLDVYTNVVGSLQSKTKTSKDQPRGSS